MQNMLDLLQDDINPDLDNKGSAFEIPTGMFKLAAISGRQALINAAIKNVLTLINAGLVLGTCSGPMLTIEDQYKTRINNGTNAN